MSHHLQCTVSETSPQSINMALAALLLLLVDIYQSSTYGLLLQIPDAVRGIIVCLQRFS